MGQSPPPPRGPCLVRGLVVSSPQNFSDCKTPAGVGKRRNGAEGGGIGSRMGGVK